MRACPSELVLLLNPFRDRTLIPRSSHVAARGDEGLHQMAKAQGGGLSAAHHASGLVGTFEAVDHDQTSHHAESVCHNLNPLAQTVVEYLYWHLLV